MRSLRLKKHSTEILVVAGTAGTVVSAVLACKATTKVAEILDETKGTLDTIHDGMETGAINGQEYTTEDGKKDTVVVYQKLVSLYTAKGGKSHGVELQIRREHSPADCT